MEDARFPNHDYLKNASKWTQIGVKVTGEFLKIVGPRHALNSVRHIRKEDGSLTTDPIEMRLVAIEF